MIHHNSYRRAKVGTRQKYQKCPTPECDELAEESNKYQFSHPILESTFRQNI